MPQRRKPIDQHRAADTYRKDRHSNRPATPGDIPTLPPAPPPGMTTGAAAEWQRITALLGTRGRLTALDTTALRAYCELSGELAEDPRAFTAARHTALRLLAAELGLTPASRTKLPEAKQERPENPFAAFD